MTARVCRRVRVNFHCGHSRWLDRRGLRRGLRYPFDTGVPCSSTTTEGGSVRNLSLPGFVGMESSAYSELWEA